MTICPMRCFGYLEKATRTVRCVLCGTIHVAESPKVRYRTRPRDDEGPVGVTPQPSPAEGSSSLDGAPRSEREQDPGQPRRERD